MHYQRDLGAYVGVYLCEEIQAEGLTRSIGNFGRVLEMAAQYNGQQVNFTQLGSDALEHLVFLELKAYLDYTFSSARLSYWRSQSKFEVDFLIDDKIAIEVKGTTRVSGTDLKGIKALAEEVPLQRKIVVSSEPTPRYIDCIEIMHFDAFFKALWTHEIIDG